MCGYVFALAASMRAPACAGTAFAAVTIPAGIKVRPAEMGSALSRRVSGGDADPLGCRCGSHARSTLRPYPFFFLHRHRKRQ